jgi:hypothetical protein
VSGFFPHPLPPHPVPSNKNLSTKHKQNFKPNTALNMVENLYDHSSIWECAGSGRGCNKSFINLKALNQHLRDSKNHYWCFKCDEEFYTAAGLVCHYTDQHYTCQLCGEDHYDQYDLDEHKENEHYQCDHSGCSHLFWTMNDLRRHKKDIHNYCLDCNRQFSSSANLYAHRRSKQHRVPNVRCPMPGCGGAFVTRSALALHWDQGNCAGGADQIVVGDYVYANDTRRRWTYGQRRRNGMVNYHCPRDGCGADFGLFSALAQHIESNTCGALNDYVVRSELGNYTNKSLMRKPFEVC